MKNKINLIFLFIQLVLFTLEIYAKEDAPVPLFYSIMPGGTYLYEGDNGPGIAFLTSEMSLLVIGLSITDKLDKNELNLPLLYASQLYAIDKWNYFQKSMTKYSKYNSSLRFDSTPISELLTAPFNMKNILSPLVITFALLGIADGIIGYPKYNEKYSDITNVTAMTNQMNPETGTYYYGSMAFATSYGAAISEEMIFRGFLLPVLDYKYGQKTGLITTSLTFGLLHLANPNIYDPVYLVSQATLAGLIFGYIVQKNGYKLNKVITAHFWYDFFSMTTTWLINPKENPLGIRLKFRFY